MGTDRPQDTWTSRTQALMLPRHIQTGAQELPELGPGLGRGAAARGGGRAPGSDRSGSLRRPLTLRQDEPHTIRGPTASEGHPAFNFPE